ncbi:baseplate wedge subunit and tail pin [Klebsiella phage EI]|uniref:Baseplate wedge subunit/tail pin n=1 Tax=Klebsiella phage Marfa TaxID=2587809 RepID=A0A4Y5TS45_9CAUD|nr:baseplate wedge subunit [Klebsiella phage Marfa]QDB71819.1 baseplate wedge subunit/tail pin [Klebsiella phage Marfa]QEM42377.1 baseplate wedge subunit and tail pin [Klebsiella phage EI]
MIFTKTREGAKVPSREANYLQFELDPEDISVGDQVPYGSVTLKQTQHGVWYPNIQAAIDDVRAMIPSDVGEVVTNVTGISPGKTQQITRAVFSGVVKLEDETSEEIVEILGVAVKLKNGDTAEIAAAKWLNILESMVADKIAIAAVFSSASTQNIVDITHLDYQNHTFETFKWNGITVNFSVLSPAKQGYGSWNFLGSEDKVFASNTVRFHYFQRIS